MLANGLDDPCQPQENLAENDRKTQATRCLFVYAWDMHKGNWITRTDIYQLIDPADFIPSREWQDVPKGFAVPPGGKYQTDPKTGKRQVRWDSPPPAGSTFHVYRDEFSWFGRLREGDEVRSNQTKLGITLDTFNGRELCGIKFTIGKSTPGRGVRYQFQKM